MGRKKSKKPQRPMRGFTKVVFDSDSEQPDAAPPGITRTTVTCVQCGKAACFCPRGLAQMKAGSQKIAATSTPLSNGREMKENGKDRKGKNKNKKKDKEHKNKRTDSSKVKIENSESDSTATELQKGSDIASLSESSSSSLPSSHKSNSDAAVRKAAKAKAKAAAKKARRAERAALATRISKDIFPEGYLAPSHHSSSENRFGHAFSSEFNDHFETPLCAYADLAPLLRCLNAQTKIIYDPFFCKGSMVRHMLSLGFKNIINRNEDFWAVLRDCRLPAFDIIVTNPPYSDEDKERTVKFVVASGKPGFVLIPSYCANKAWFKKACLGSSNSSKSRLDSTTSISTDKVFVVRPAGDYQYAHIEGKGHRASPFHSSWFCFNIPFLENASVMEGSGRKAKVCSVSDLSKVGVRFKKRLNPRQRKKRRMGAK